MMKGLSCVSLPEMGKDIPTLDGAGSHAVVQLPELFELQRLFEAPAHPLNLISSEHIVGIRHNRCQFPIDGLTFQKWEAAA